MVFKVLVDVMRQVALLVAFVQNIAANDQVEPAVDFGILVLFTVLAPVAMLIIHGAELVQSQVFA